jgi:hypothetical protein
MASDPIAALTFDMLERIADTWRASIIADLAIATLLVDAGTITAAEVVKRIEGLQNRMPEEFQRAEVMLRLEPILSSTRDHPTGRSA